jgi:hypothetical protein
MTFKSSSKQQREALKNVLNRLSMLASTSDHSNRPDDTELVLSFRSFFLLFSTLIFVQVKQKPDLVVSMTPADLPKTWFLDLGKSHDLHVRSRKL